MTLDSCSLILLWNLQTVASAAAALSKHNTVSLCHQCTSASEDRGRRPPNSSEQIRFTNCQLL